MSSNDSTSDTQSSSSTFASEYPSDKDDRTSLIEKARGFLLSPSVRHEDETAKRKFLQEKGLSNEEVDSLIQELPRQPPPVPPRTYPPLPPSELPALLASLFRVSMWASGFSAIILLGYFRLLLPLTTQSLGARRKLMLHQSGLMLRLIYRVSEVKRTQSDAYVALPRAPREHEAPPAGIKSLAELPVDSNGKPTHSISTVIHCAFLEKPEQRFTVEELYDALSNQFPGLTSDASEFQSSISRELSRSKAFYKSHDGGPEHWTLSLDTTSTPSFSSAPPAPLTESIKDLHNALSQGYREHNKYNYTFKSLTDFTGFLSRETYTLYGANSGLRYGISTGYPLGPAEEDVRREIRALKGLVLNRRSFVPSPHRQTTATLGAT